MVKGSFLEGAPEIEVLHAYTGENTEKLKEMISLVHRRRETKKLPGRAVSPAGRQSVHYIRIWHGCNGNAAGRDCAYRR